MSPVLSSQPFFCLVILQIHFFIRSILKGPHFHLILSDPSTWILQDHWHVHAVEFSQARSSVPREISPKQLHYYLTSPKPFNRQQKYQKYYVKTWHKHMIELYSKLKKHEIMAFSVKLIELAYCKMEWVRFRRWIPNDFSHLWASRFGVGGKLCVYVYICNFR